MRIGSGFDVHAFGPGSFVMLAGVRIAHSRGVEAHSDGDVVLHALTDALLGAGALGDIGQHFPDSDARFRGADSGVFVRAALAMLAREKLKVVNVDVTVLAEEPKIAPHRQAMYASLRELLGTPLVNIKATTMEGLGAIGRREGLAAQVVVLLSNT